MKILVVGLVGMALAWASPLRSAENPDPDDVSALKDAYSAFEVFVEVGDTAHALSQAKKAYELGQRVYGADHPNTAALAHNYGSTLLATGDKEAAAQSLEEALRLYEAAYGRESEELVAVLMDLGKAVGEPGRPKKQTASFDRALKLAKQHFGSDSLKYGELSLSAGTSIMEDSSLPAAEKYIEAAYRVFGASLGEQHERTAYAAFQMARLEFYWRRYREAGQYLSAALATFADPDHPSTAFELNVHLWLVQVYQSLGEPDAATPHCLAIGRMTPIEANQALLPLFRQAPTYPPWAQEQQREGAVIVKYTVDELGIVRDPEVVKTEGGSIFEQAALQAVSAFRYAPRFVAGKPVATPDVMHKITFEIEH